MTYRYLNLLEFNAPSQEEVTGACLATEISGWFKMY